MHAWRLICPLPYQRVDRDLPVGLHQESKVIGVQETTIAHRHNAPSTTASPDQHQARHTNDIYGTEIFYSITSDTIITNAPDRTIEGITNDLNLSRVDLAYLHNYTLHQCRNRAHPPERNKG